MNTDERILQVLENSACLSKGQLVGYLKNTLYPEELRAVELHLSGCPFCNDALEGLSSQIDIDKILGSLVPPVLPAIAPKEKEKPKEKKELPVSVKLEKAKPAAASTVSPSVSDAGEATSFHKRPLNWKKPLAFAAAIIIGFGAFWYFGTRPKENKQLAVNTELDTVTTTPVAVSSDMAPVVAKHEIVDTSARPVVTEHKKAADSAATKKVTQNIASVQDTLISNRNEPVARQMAASPSTEAVAADEATSDEKEQAVAAKAKKEVAKEPQTDYEMGLKLYKQNQYASALLYLKDAESDKGDPKHWDAVFYSALCNKYLGKDRRARKQFERIVEANAPYKKAAQKQLDEMKNKE